MTERKLELVLAREAPIAPGILNQQELKLYQHVLREQ